MAAAQFPRWTAGEAAIDFRLAQSRPVELSLDFVQPDFGKRRLLPDMSITSDGRLQHWTSIQQAPPGWFRGTVDLGRVTAGLHRLVIRAATFIPAEREASNDHRLLGVQIRSLRLRPMGSRDLVAVPIQSIPPLPVSSDQLWGRAAFGWFMDPRYPHLVDMWPWYVIESGLPRGLAWLVLIPLVGLAASGWKLAHMTADLRAQVR